MYKEWPFVEAKKLISRARKAKKEKVTLESGYGPSGLPHIGTFAEAARTSFVIRAIKKLAPELKAQFIAFSDDMDGLRAIPENIPNPEMLKKHIGKPLCDIPDPYGEYGSYSENMNNRLKSFLDSFGFEYDFISSADMYKNGAFNDGLEIILKKHEKVIKIFTAMISEEKRETWSPFFPTCQYCGKNTTVLVTEHDVANNMIRYECVHEPNELTSPCHHKGEVSIFDGHAKVGWKIDWALRWFTLGIDYEMYGKDLIDSAVISEKIVRLLGSAPPLTYKYELFLDEFGKKISKKLGNGVSLEEWLEYASTDVLLNFLFLKPNQPKKMALSLIPRAVDDYLLKVKKFDGEEDSSIHLMEGKDVTPDKYAYISSQIDFTLIVNLIKALNITDVDMVMEYLTQYDPAISDEKSYAFYKGLVGKAIAYNEKVLKKKDKTPLSIDKSFDPYLSAFNDELKGLSKEADIVPDDVQTVCFSVAKENNLNFKEWFTYLYQVLLDQESGPKIGSFICLFGIESTISRIESYISGK